jgi:hypothetical protein
MDHKQGQVISWKLIKFLNMLLQIIVVKTQNSNCHLLIWLVLIGTILLVVDSRDRWLGSSFFLMLTLLFLVSLVLNFHFNWLNLVVLRVFFLENDDQILLLSG